VVSTVLSPHRNPREIIPVTPMIEDDAIRHGRLGFEGVEGCDIVNEA